MHERRAAWAWGELALAQREPDVALRIADRLIASAPGAAHGQPIPALLKVRGEALWALGHNDAAVEALEEARRSAQGRGVLPLLWQIHRSLARVYTARKQKSLAHDANAAARAMIDALATSVDEGAQRQRFVAAALASLPPEQALSVRQVAKQAFDGLSAREREVAILIAQGRSSREVADALVISQRTVETHVEHIYAKLGFNTRAQLAAWAVEKGLAHARPR